MLDFVLGLFCNDSTVWNERRLKTLKRLHPSFPSEFLQSFHLFINFSLQNIEEVNQYKLRNIFNAFKIQMNHNLLWDLIKLAHGSTIRFPTLASCCQTKS